MIQPYTCKDLMHYHNEFEHRFRVELEFITEQIAFLEINFAHCSNENASAPTPQELALENLFQCSLEGLSLCLSRLWESPPRGQNKMNDKKFYLSLPVLIAWFSDIRVETTHDLKEENLESDVFQDLLGARNLMRGKPDRLECEEICELPIIGQLRTARSETLAHNLRVGKSHDRKRSVISDMDGFDIQSGDIVALARRTGKILSATVDNFHSPSEQFLQNNFEKNIDEKRRAYASIFKDFF